MKPQACSPTMNQVDAAILMTGQIAELLPFVPATAATILNEVVPRLKKIKDGYCISDMDNFLEYVWKQITGVEKEARMRGFKGFKAGADRSPMLRK